MVFNNQAFGSLNRRTLVKRFGMVAAGTLAVSISPTFALANDNNRLNDNASGHKPSGFNVVLVHGAFADASSWSEVSWLLQHQGHNVLAVQLPLRPRLPTMWRLSSKPWPL